MENETKIPNKLSSRNIHTYISIQKSVKSARTTRDFSYFLEGLKSLPDKIMLRIFGVEAAHFQL